MVRVAVLVKTILVIKINHFNFPGAYSEVNYKYTNRMSQKFRYRNLLTSKK